MSRDGDSRTLTRELWTDMGEGSGTTLGMGFFGDSIIGTKDNPQHSILLIPWAGKPDRRGMISSSAGEYISRGLPGSGGRTPHPLGVGAPEKNRAKTRSGMRSKREWMAEALGRVLIRAMRKPRPIEGGVSPILQGPGPDIERPDLRRACFRQGHPRGFRNALGSRRKLVGPRGGGH